ncbi:15507_t:CDS:1, partial [Acaulospora morrowiae]
ELKMVYSKKNNLYSLQFWIPLLMTLLITSLLQATNVYSATIQRKETINDFGGNNLDAALLKRDESIKRKDSDIVDVSSQLPSITSLSKRTYRRVWVFWYDNDGTRDCGNYCLITFILVAVILLGLIFCGCLSCYRIKRRYETDSGLSFFSHNSNQRRHRSQSSGSMSEVYARK